MGFPEQSPLYVKGAEPGYGRITPEHVPAQKPKPHPEAPEMRIDPKELERWYQVLHNFVTYDHTNVESLVDLRDDLYNYLR